MASSQYKMSSYSKFLLELACELTPDDIGKIKLVLAAEEIVPEERRDRIRTAAELFIQLQEIGMLGARDVTFFEEVLPGIGRRDLSSLIIKFKEVWDTPSEVPVQTLHKTIWSTGTETMTSYIDVDMRSDSDRQSTHSLVSHSSQSRGRLTSYASSLSDDEKMEETKKLSKQAKRKAGRKKTMFSGLFRK